MSMKSTEESQISTDKSQVAVYFNDISQDQLSQSFDFGKIIFLKVVYVFFVPNLYVVKITPFYL